MVLLIKKLALERGTALKCSKTITHLSYVLFGVAAVYFMLVFSGSTRFVAPAVMCIIGGYIMTVYANNSRALSGRYKQYIDIIVNLGETSIDNIANAVGTSYDTAIQDLEKMIAAGYFPGMRINNHKRTISIAVPQFGSNPFARSGGVQQDRVATCDSCGANNVVTAGKLPECEYCDSPL